MCALVLHDEISLGEQIKSIKYQNGKNATKIKLFLLLIQTSLFILNERIESNYSYKRAFLFN